MTVWPSGLRRWLQAPVRKGVGSNPTAVTLFATMPTQSCWRCTDATYQRAGPGQHAYASCSRAMVDERMVPRGLEPRTLRLLAVRSNQLSYETSDRYE